MNNIKFGDVQMMQLPREKRPEHVGGSRSRILEQNVDFFLYVLKSAEEKIIDHLNCTPKIESGGVLIGHPFVDIDDSSKIFTVVVDALPIQSENSSIGHYTVSPENISDTRQLIPDGLMSIGWYHSHPGHGVFLSGADMNIVRSIYSLSWQISFVVDTLRGIKGFFHGEKGDKVKDIYYLNYKPLIIESVARYNCAVRAQEEGDISVLEHFKIWLQRNTATELSHWRKAGIYQDIRLDEVESSSMSETEWDREFKKAVKYYESGRLQVAQMIFEQLQKQSRNAEVSEYLDKINRQLRNSF